MKNFVAFLACVLMMGAVALADQGSTDKGPMTGSEKAFVQKVSADLSQRFPTPADAQKAGYVRYTNPDDSGAISYANMQWTSQDPTHPSQLWYDKNGRLMGADFSVPYTKGAARPNLFGVNPGRWIEFDDHVHWVGKTASGAPTYDNYIMAPDYVKGGGDPANPTAADLVKMGKAANPSAVSTVFDMPAIWDLVVWVIPNPAGAFAYNNPAVKP